MRPTRRQFVVSLVGTGALNSVTSKYLDEFVAKSPLDVALFLDVEDIFSPPEVGNDTSIKELATILSDEGLRANFLFIGDRAQLLAERGRQDVIRSLEPHDVGLHGRTGRHPAGAEYLQGKSWDEGVAECVKRDRDGAEIVRSVFDKPCAAMSAHGVYDSPHAQRSAAILGVPYIYGYPAAPPLYGVSWYAGALGLPYRSPTSDGRTFRAYFDGFDDKYPDDEKFEAHLHQLDGQIDNCLKEGQPFLALFVYHPQKVRLMDFIDSYWCPNGVNYPKERWGRYGNPRRRTPEQVKSALINFRRLARWIRNDRRLNVLTITQVVQRYGQRPKTITHEELLGAAQAISKSDQILMNVKFSPAEIVYGLARSVIAFADDRRILSEISREDVLGPTHGPIWVSELIGCNRETLVQLTRDLLNHISTTGSLPANLGSPLSRVGVNHMYRALADNFLGISDGALPPETKFERVAPYPELGGPIALSYLQQLENGAMNPDTDINTIYRDGKLQTWTLKPAIMP